MKKLIYVIGFSMLTLLIPAQSPTYLIGTNRNGSNEITRFLNTTSGNFTNLSVLPGATSIVQGETAYDAANQRYFNKTNLGITVINAQTGALINVISTTVQIKGIEYNPNTNALIGSYWNGSSEIFASVNISNGQITGIGILNGVTSVAQGETAFDAATNRYFNKTTTCINVINALNGAITATLAGSNFKGMEYNPNTNKLIGSVWNGSSEIYSTLDISTGLVTSIAAIPGVQGVVQGETAFDAAGNRYFNRTNLGTLVMNAQTGALLNTIPGASTIFGIEYIGGANPCNLNSTLLPSPVLYATQGSNASFSVSCNASGANYTWQSNPGYFGWLNVPANATYSGTSTAILTVNNVSLQNHLQPFRVIVTSGNCSDTTGVSYLQLTDTCIVSDTVHVVVTDSLIISLTVTGMSQTTQNTLRVYPNPAHSYLIIDNGNYAVMNGYSVKISNTIGQEMYSSKINQQQFQVDLNSMTVKGVYFLRILDGNDAVVEVKKIIIQ